MTKKGIALGITGGIACGKSAVGRVLARKGFAVRDADDIAHGFMVPGQEVYEKVVAHFGKDVIAPDGQLDRSLLGRRVFADKNELQLLNQIVHPVVLAEIRNWVKTQTDNGTHVAGIIPLLFEVGETAPWNAIVCVSASPEIVCARMRQRGLSNEEIAMRLKAQMPLEEKERRADYGIINNGTLEDLYERTSALLVTILNKEMRSHG
ncbi:MAG: dephospho-CoA kinase [Spartobacteria bacterium]|nr:dephospho-CoA kinase [Spartobacteria bacterium]